MPKLDLRTIAKGLGTYALMAVLIPVALVLLASLGPSEWVAQYIEPAKRLQFLFVVAVGGIVAGLSRTHPLAHSVVVGAIGGLVSFCLVAGLNAAPHLNLVSSFVQYVLMAAVWCFVGALVVSFLRRGRYAL